MLFAIKYEVAGKSRIKSHPNLGFSGPNGKLFSGMSVPRIFHVFLRYLSLPSAASERGVTEAPARSL